MSHDHDQPREYVWSDLYQRAVDAFGSAPSAPIEQRILDVFSSQPALVEQAIGHVGSRFKAGLIRAPWVVLAKHVEEAATGTSRTDVRATEGRDRDVAVARAERWLRATGLHFDRESELRDELFGDRGVLRHWADDEALEHRIMTLWHELRPRAERAERELEQRLAAHREAWRLLHRTRPPLRALEPDDDTPANPFLTAEEAAL